jgi:hypothetical protein
MIDLYDPSRLETSSHITPNGAARAGTDASIGIDRACSLWLDRDTQSGLKAARWESPKPSTMGLGGGQWTRRRSSESA